MVFIMLLKAFRLVERITDYSYIKADTKFFFFLGWIYYAVQSDGSVAGKEYFAEAGVEHFMFLYRGSLYHLTYTYKTTSCI